MSIIVKKFKQEEEKRWDVFIDHSNNGTLFHKRKFLNYHPSERFIDHSLIFEKKGHIVGLLPGVIKKIEGKKLLISHPGASVGSCVVMEQLSFANSLAIVKALSKYAVSNNIDSIRLTKPPIIYQKNISQYMDFAFMQEGYSYLRRELSSYVHICDNIENNVLKFKSSHRTSFRKAKKTGIQIKISEDYKTFYTILKNNLSTRHNIHPTHTLSELQRLKRIFPDNIHLFSAYLKNEMIAGVVSFIVSPKVILAFYISHKQEFENYRPINLLIYDIIKWSIENQIKTLDFGIFTVNEKPNMGLARFKENFGASGIFRDTLELNL